VVWIWEFTGTSVEHDVLRYGYYPCSLEGPCVAPAALVHHLPWYEGVFSSMFMHGGWLHIGGNMLFLWIFGNNVEDAFGRIRFLVWYLAAGIVAAGVQTFVTLAFTDPSGASIPNVGASGAIAGVLGAYFILLPTASVLTAFIIVFFVFLREIPAVLFLGLWFVFQLWEGGFSILQPQAGGGVAFFAHIGGFAFGLATALLIRKRRPLAPKW
jgi:membrane associated rhomboid family serine protease